MEHMYEIRKTWEVRAEHKAERERTEIIGLIHPSNKLPVGTAGI